MIKLKENKEEEWNKSKNRKQQENLLKFRISVGERK